MGQSLPQGPGQKGARGTEKAKTLEEKPHSPCCSSASSPFFSGIPTLHPVFLELVFLRYPPIFHTHQSGLSTSQLPTWYLLWPQTPRDWGHQLGLVSDAWLLAVSLSESLRPEAFHWQRMGPLPLPSGKGWGSTMRGAPTDSYQK